MNRRAFVLAGMAGAMSASASPWPDSKARSWFEVKFFYLRNDLERTRLDQFLKSAYLPMAKRIGIGPIGFFNVSVGPQQPTLVRVIAYPTLASVESTFDKMAQDRSWNQALDEFDKNKTMAYTRTESRLLRAFATMPSLEVPPQNASHPPRLFELRIYESKNVRTGETKIRMFEEAEIAIFRRCGLLPVFFGQTVVGSGLPSLTYMLAFDSAEAREDSWRKFLQDPDWIKLRSMPEFADTEIVSSINSYFLRPTDYSLIR